MEREGMVKRGSEAAGTAAEAEEAPLTLRTLARRAFAQPVEEGPAALPEMPSVDSAPEPHPFFGLLLSPVIAAAMVLSSVSFVGNALRLRTVRVG